MNTLGNRKISFWCTNHKEPVEMVIQQGISPFYACPKYFPENRDEKDSKACPNRMTIIDAGGIIDAFAKICEAEDPFESVTNYYNYMFEYKGSKSKFIVTIIKYTDDEIRFGVLNKTSLK